MDKIIKLKESDIQRIVKRTINEQDNKEEWKDKLHQRLWQAIEDIDEERETQAAVKLSTEDVVDVLESMINSLDPIEDNYDEESGAWFGHNL
jgi:uncharacterized protein YpbB